MVTGSRTEGGTGTHMLSAKVRKTIQSIREIVGNHSDADIYVSLKESNMDPNETTQKLLNQDPFHEVKRRRDRKKETQDFGNKGLGESRRHSENGGQGLQFHTSSERDGRRTNYSRNPLPRVSREFRVVRDNRVNHVYEEPPSLQHSTSTAEQTVVNTLEKKGSSAAYTNQRSSSGARNYQAVSSPSDSHGRQSTDAVSNVSNRKITNEDKQGTMLNASAMVQPTKPNNVHQNSSTNASSSSAMGVYSSSTDPVHVPSPDSRSPGVVGAIRREVGVVGVRRLSSDNKAKQLFVPSSSHTSSLVEKDAPSADSVGTISKSENSQTTVTEPSLSGMSASRPSLNNLYNSRQHQQLAGQRVSQHNKEWKPKSSQKANNSPGVIGTPKKTASPLAQNSEDVESEEVKLTDNLSKVTIAQHICVANTDRLRLTFGTLGVGAKLDLFGCQSKIHFDGATEKSSGELTTSVVPSPELSSDDVSGNTQVDMLDDEHIRNLVSDSPVSGAASEQQLPDNKESSSPQNLDNYTANVGLERDTSRPFVPSESQQQDSHDMPGFSAYDPPNGYDIPYFRPTIDETVRGRILSPPHEGLSSHATNNVPMTTISMVQQQQPPVAQMYPQVHVSHYANLMPYRQFLSPVYVPPMAVQGYSNNSPYPHPYLNANNLKYGVQQFKPVPAGSPTGFGNFGNPTGYAMLGPGVVGGTTALEDSSRVKYKDNLFVPNPQGETSKIWLQNPRDLSGMQSSPYYNMPPGQSPHAAAFVPSQHGHHNHASFNAAAAQSSHNHMQFPAGMYHTHTPPQQAAAAHHIANNVGVGVGVAAASPGAQVGAYQQPQLGQFNWTTSF